MKVDLFLPGDGVCHHPERREYRASCCKGMLRRCSISVIKRWDVKGKKLEELQSRQGPKSERRDFDTKLVVVNGLPISVIKRWDVGEKHILSRVEVKARARTRTTRLRRQSTRHCE